MQQPTEIATMILLKVKQKTKFTAFTVHFFNRRKT